MSELSSDGKSFEFFSQERHNFSLRRADSAFFALPLRSLCFNSISSSLMSRGPCRLFSLALFDKRIGSVAIKAPINAISGAT